MATPRTDEYDRRHLSDGAREESVDAVTATALRALRVRDWSSDSWIYLSKANELVFSNDGAPVGLDDLVPVAAAREAADLYEHALGIRPSNADAIPGFVLALLNVESVTDADTLTLNASRMMFPTQGLLLVGQAAVDKQRGNVRDAVQWLGQAYTEPFTLPRGFRQAVVALREKWQGEWFSNQLARRVLGTGREPLADGD